MRNLFITLVLFYSYNAACQDKSLAINNTARDQIQQYLKKSKIRKTAGFLMLGSGALVLFTTRSFIKGETAFDDMGFELIKLVVGSALTIGSILEFSSSTKFKRKAQLLLLKQKISGPLKLKDQLLLGISINL